MLNQQVIIRDILFLQVSEHMRIVMRLLLKTCVILTCITMWCVKILMYVILFLK